MVDLAGGFGRSEEEEGGRLGGASLEGRFWDLVCLTTTLINLFGKVRFWALDTEYIWF